jgi:hypothetical protein
MWQLLRRHTHGLDGLPEFLAQMGACLITREAFLCGPGHHLRKDFWLLLSARDVS